MPQEVFPVAVAALAFISVSLLAYTAASVLSERRSGAWRLARLARMMPGEIAVSRESQRGGAQGSTGTGRVRRAGGKSSMRALLAILGRAFEGKSYAARIDRELASADIPLRGSEFVVMNLLLVVAALFVGVVLARSAAFALVLAVAAGFAPNLYVKGRQAARLGRVNAQIADALVIMANSLRAGYSFLQAMDMVSREMPPPISDEFSAAMKEMGLGAPTEAALTGLSERIASDDMQLVITAVLIQRQIGGNLAEILDNIAHTIRERVRIRAEIRTLTAQGRLSGIIIGILPMALGCFLYAINPSYIMLLFSHPIGRVMVAMAVVGELVGAFVIKKIVSIEV